MYSLSNALAFSRSHMAMLKSFGHQLSHTPIKTFCYLRFYKEGKLLYLSNNDAWLKAYLYGEYYNHSEHTRCYTANGKGGYYAWLGNETDDVFLRAKELNILNGVNFCKQHDDFCETFIFSASLEHIDSANYYVNNIHNIKQMIHLFSNQYLARLPVDKKDLLDINMNVKKQISAYCDTYTNENKSKVMLDENTCIGKKALACLYWTCQGKSADEIAIILHISRRTVEDHLLSLKIKLNCANKCELIYKTLTRWPNIISDFRQ